MCRDEDEAAAAAAAAAADGGGGEVAGHSGVSFWMELLS
eukprot:COSAG01_NODE_5298_length_4352_cov_3.291089_1_plen_38_part_10